MREIKKDYNLCKKNPKKYTEKLDNLSDLFELEGKDRFKADSFPSGITGNYRKRNHFMIFSLNPGYGEFNPVENRLRSDSWEEYKIAQREKYLWMKKVNHTSRYYKSFWLFFKGLMKKSNNYHNQWDFYNDHITNLNLIPYHSKGISLKNKFTLHQLEYLLPRFSRTLDFIKKYKPKMLLFNGKPWYTFLIYHNLINDYEVKTVNKKFKIYFFDIDGIPCVLFEKFFSKHFWLTDNERSNKIPEIIQIKYPNLFK